MLKQKVGLAIVTYTINYGTFLQAFATQAAVQKLGYDTEILNINSVISDVSKARKKYFASQIFNLAELKSYRHTISALVAKKVDRKYRNFIKQRENRFFAFQDKYFHIGENCNSWQGLSEHCNQFSSVLVGSDQLWRPANIAGNFYTLNFVPENINKVSYATSFGLKQIRENQRVCAREFLNRIQHLSSREESGVEIIREVTGREAKVVCDPTLLLSKEDWEQFVPEKPIIDGDYVLAYLLGENKNHRSFVKQLAKQTGCKVVGVLHGAGYIRGDENFVDEAPEGIDPFEFLNLIKFAKYVCTDSFHGCVFSTIFEKEYFAFKRFSDKDKMSTNTRVTGLLKRLGLMDHLIDSTEKSLPETIRYEQVKKAVEEFRAESLCFLEGALKG